MYIDVVGKIIIDKNHQRIYGTIISILYKLGEILWFFFTSMDLEPLFYSFVITKTMLGRQSRPAGGGRADVRATETVKGRKRQLYRITPGDYRDLGALQGWQREGNRKRYGKHTIMGSEAQTTSGGRQMWAPSKWTVAPYLGEFGGGEAGAMRE